MIILHFVAVVLKPQLHVSQYVKCATSTRITRAVRVYTGRESKIRNVMKDQSCASAALPKIAPVRHPLHGRLGG
jgi:hypothetical protein